MALVGFSSTVWCFQAENILMTTASWCPQSLNPSGAALEDLRFPTAVRFPCPSCLTILEGVELVTDV